MPEAQLLAINPYFLVDDVYKSAEYYRDVLGFEFQQFWGERPAFVMLHRDGVQSMLRQPATAGDSVARPNRRRTSHALDAYVYVKDVDALYAELRESGARATGRANRPATRLPRVRGQRPERLRALFWPGSTSVERRASRACAAPERRPSSRAH